MVTDCAMRLPNGRIEYATHYDASLMRQDFHISVQ